MQRLVGAVQNYAWGSTTRLAQLRNIEESTEPEAEIWYGAHGRAPSTFFDGTTLLDAIANDPEGQLGREVLDRHGPQLPFLVKLLAADSPLSIQAHPSADQALAGCAVEDEAGIDRAAPHRCFRDENPKPELVFALSDFEALVGFRNSAKTAEFLADIDFDGFSSLLAAGPKAAVEALLDPQSAGGSRESVAELISSFVASCAAYGGDDWAAVADLMVRLDSAYPADPGVGVAALLNYIVLQPGEAIFLDAGHLHAYVSGLAVEVMANSDNVLRGGLTPKHIDVPTLLDIVVTDEIEPTLVEQSSEGTLMADCPAFALTAQSNPAGVELVGPQIVLVTNGSISMSSEGESAGHEALELAPTEAAWIEAGERIVLNGTGLCFSIATGAG